MTLPSVKIIKLYTYIWYTILNVYQISVQNLKV